MAFFCSDCQRLSELVTETIEIDVKGKDLPCVIEGVIVDKCPQCNRVDYGEVALDYIKAKTKIFECSGIDNKIEAIAKRKGMKKAELARAAGMSRQNFYDRMLLPHALTQIVLQTFAVALDVNMGELSDFYPIIEKDHKYYLGPKYVAGGTSS